MLGVTTLHAEPMVGPTVADFHLNLELRLKGKARKIESVFPTFQCVVPPNKRPLTVQTKADFSVTDGKPLRIRINAPRVGFPEEISKPKNCYVSLAIVALSPYGKVKIESFDVPLPKEEAEKIQRRSESEADVYNEKTPFPHGLQVVLFGSRVEMDRNELRRMLTDTDLASKIETKWTLLSISCDEDGCRGELL
jgi:hypothetical protein